MRIGGRLEGDWFHREAAAAVRGLNRDKSVHAYRVAADAVGNVRIIRFCGINGQFIGRARYVRMRYDATACGHIVAVDPTFMLKARADKRFGPTVVVEIVATAHEHAVGKAWNAAAATVVIDGRAVAQEAFRENM